MPPFRTTLLCTALCACSLVHACKASNTDKPRDGESKSQRPPEAAEFSVQLVDLDGAMRHRGSRPFIAGERVRLTLAIDGGQAPYSIELDSKELGLESHSTTLDIEESVGQIESALELRLPPEASSGEFRLRTRLVDSKGASAAASTDSFPIVGEGAPLRPATPPPWPLPHIELVDAGGRSRLSFYRGEVLELRVHLKEAGPLAVVLSSDDAQLSMPKRSYQARDELFRVPLPIPRLAQSGTYAVEVATAGGEESLAFEVAGPSFTPTTKLGVSELSLLGGPANSTPRKGILHRGEELTLEAVVAGIETACDAELRLRDRRGAVVHTQSLRGLAPTAPTPTRRYLLSSSVELPRSLAVGRYVLELELSEGDELATLYRDVLLR